MGRCTSDLGNINRQARLGRCDQLVESLGVSEMLRGPGDVLKHKRAAFTAATAQNKGRGRGITVTTNMSENLAGVERQHTSRAYLHLFGAQRRTHKSLSP